MANPDQSEQHPMLPSGYWTGFYVYSYTAARHEMMIMLDFLKDRISGDGSDDVGAFTFVGTYDLGAMTCHFLKHYSTHSIDYTGNIDENGIWGRWAYIAGGSTKQEDLDFIRRIAPGRLFGGFHIWPSNKEFSEYELAIRKVREEEVVKEVVKEPVKVPLKS